MSNIVVGLIRYYQRLSKTTLISSLPLLVTPACRFYPSCSDYTIEAIENEGALKGSIKGFIRILKCNPLNNNFK